MVSKSILFETERLVLRKVEEDDIDLFRKLFCDSKMMKYLGCTWDEELIYITLKEWISEWGKKNYYYCVIVVANTNQKIGIAGFTDNTNPEENGIEISWFIVPEHQCKGYATEITKAILKYVFNILGKERIIAETHPDNEASIKVLVKSGFTYIGEKNRKIEYLPGMDRQVLWEYKKSDWNSRI